MITLSRPKGPMDILRLYALYLAAFPPTERKPFGIIVKMAKEGRTDLWRINADGGFAGMAATVNGPELVLLDYFAVKKSLRGRGIGSEAMGELQKRYADRGFLVEIESTRMESQNRAEREKRKRFYLSAGLEDLDVEVDLFGVRMELLGARCSLDFESYKDFYCTFYSPRAAAHVRPVSEDI